MGDLRNAYTILVGKPEGEGTLGKPRRGWKDNIVMDLKGNWVGKCGLNSSGPVAESCEHDNKHLVSMKCWKFLEYLSDY
jgi:hypothetical protein